MSAAASMPWSLVRLARPHQWSKSVFVLIGPFYGLRDMASAGRSLWDSVWPALLAAAAFALASSACYVVNDIFDRDADRRHPRKRSRPVASGAVPVRVAWAWAAALLAGSVALILFLPDSARMIAAKTGEQPFTISPRVLVAFTIGLYALNVFAYSAVIKHLVIADVMSLSMGFVLRVMGGCAAVGVTPTVWLLNVTLFLSMFLAFGKRLGERRTLSNDESLDRAESHRPVQAKYTDALLQMMVVVTGVATLMGYAGYIQAHDADYVLGFNLLWLSILPATYCLLRAIVLVERGTYDDPTELATRDRAFQFGAALFVVITAAVLWGFWAA
ncbi:MAG: UbiA family prenyltransferase [Phycisphaerales bacterium]|nr:UbiA family prenyltransferase [Phycisphaerales bacterium]